MFRLIQYSKPTSQEAIELLRQNEPPQGYFGCFSGGKDSITIKALAEIAKVKVEWHYHKTTIDPPELVQFIKREHSEVIWDRPKHGNFFSRMVQKGFPTRKARWCCDEYKEVMQPKGTVVLMGIRAEESASRAKNWSMIGKHFKTGNTVINPIFKWSSDELWDFIKGESVSYCHLYNEGFARLGCIGCPQADRLARIKEFARWPQFERKWKRAFKLIWEKRTGTKQRDGRPWFGDVFFKNWQEMWDWWLYDKSLPNLNQMNLFP